MGETEFSKEVWIEGIGPEMKKPPPDQYLKAAALELEQSHPVVSAWLEEVRLDVSAKEACREIEKKHADELGISVAHLRRCKRGIAPWPR